MDNGTTKRCYRCSRLAPLEAFGVDRSRDDGRSIYCRGCAVEKARAAYAANPERYRAASRKCRRRTYAENPEPAKAWARQQRATMPADVRARYANVAHAAGMRARAEKLRAPVIEVFTRQDIIDRDGRDCYLCGMFCVGRDATIDHVIPLTRGGEHSRANVRIACLACNRRKHQMTADEYLIRLQREAS